MMTYEEALTFIHSVCWKGSLPGLGRTQELMARLGNPEKKLKYIHVAGTNGKGSTASMLESVLRKAGYKTGLYTSPFIFRFNERMRANGEDISDQELAEITEYVKPHAQAMADAPTEFELVTAIGFEFFLRHKCDIVVLEVGLGGEMDSTNVIPSPEVAVLTNLGLEHTDVLGNSMELIAHAKAGIIKDSCPVAVYPVSEEVHKVYLEHCGGDAGRLSFADFGSIVLHEHSFLGQRFDCAGYRDLFIPLLGQHQLKNAATVLCALASLQARGWQITQQHIREGLRDVSWPGRFEVVRRNPDFIIDGGHNPQCLEALAKNVEDYLAGRRIVALTGVMADKDYGKMYGSMAPYVSAFVTVTPDNPRAMKATALAEALSVYGKPAVACDSIAAGVAEAGRLAGDDGVVLAFGSLYMVGDVRAAVLGSQNP